MTNEPPGSEELSPLQRQIGDILVASGRMDCVLVARGKKDDNMLLVGMRDDLVIDFWENGITSVHTPTGEVQTVDKGDWPGVVAILIREDFSGKDYIDSVSCPECVNKETRR